MEHIEYAGVHSGDSSCVTYIRKAAIRYHVSYFTTLPAALASARGIAASRQGGGGVTSLQEYHDGIGG